MFKNGVIVDLTKVLDENLSIYSEGEYSDPTFLVRTWCTVETQGYWVSQLSLGTQTGTHIDAPAHFKKDGATLDALPPEHLIGRYFFVDLDTFKRDQFINELTESYNNESVVFLSLQSGKAQITEESLCALCKLPAKVWIIVEDIEVLDKEPLFFHRMLAEHGIYLIEDVDEEVAKRVKPGGEIIALPLRLSGVSGSPCRVLIIQ